MTYPQYFLLLLGQAVETSQMYFQRIFVTQPGFITQQAGGRGRAYLLLTSYFKFLCLKLSWEAFLNRHHQEKTIKCMKLCVASLLEVQQPRKPRKTATALETRGDSSLEISTELRDISQCSWKAGSLPVFKRQFRIVS